MQAAIQTKNSKESSGICFSREDKAVAGLGPAAYWRYVRSPRSGTNAVCRRSCTFGTVRPPENKFRSGYWPDVVSTNDYYPFGMGMVERGDDGKYRYGFNGMQRDDEWQGAGNAYDFGARMYDGRLGRWMSVDPNKSNYFSLSPFTYVGNSPLIFIDIFGKDAIAYWEVKGKKRTLVIVADYHYIEGQFDQKVLDAAKAEYAKFSRMNFNGEKIDVRFEIGFIPHPEGSDLSAYDGKDGQNSLVRETISNADGRFEESNFKNVTVDIDRIMNLKVTAKNGDVLELNEESKMEQIVYNLCHGIGHNIGLIHDDGGIMENGELFIYEEQSLFDESKFTYSLVYESKLEVTYSNVQSLLNRIDGMTEQGRSYWIGKDEKDKITGESVDLRPTGVTIIKNED